MTIKELAKRFFPHLTPASGEALVLRLIEIFQRKP